MCEGERESVSTFLFGPLVEPRKQYKFSIAHTYSHILLPCSSFLHFSIYCGFHFSDNLRELAYHEPRNNTNVLSAQYAPTHA